MYSTGVTCLYSFSEAVLIPYSKSEANDESVSNENHQDPGGLGDCRSSDSAGSDELYRHACRNDLGIVRHPRRHDHHDHDQDRGDVSGKERRCLVTFGKASLTTKQITRVCVRALFVVNRVGCYFTS